MERKNLKIIRTGRKADPETRAQKPEQDAEPTASIPEFNKKGQVRRFFPDLRIVWVNKNDDHLSIA